MSITATRDALQALTATIPVAWNDSGQVSAPADYPHPPIAPETLPVALAWPGPGASGLLDTETRVDDRSWEIWFLVYQLTNEPDEPDINEITDNLIVLLTAAQDTYLNHPNLSVGDVRRTIQVSAVPLRDTGLVADLKYGKLTYRGFKIFAQIVEQEPVT